jgi:transcriptional regulator with XRE-family HTH domain
VYTICLEGLGKMSGDTFVNYLDEELARRNWRPADLARAAGISTGSLSQIYSGARNPGPDIASAIAKAFGIPPDVVFRKAGLLPAQPGPERDPSFQEIVDIMRNMTADERAEIVAYAQWQFQRRRSDT